MPLTQGLGSLNVTFFTNPGSEMVTSVDPLAHDMVEDTFIPL